MFEVRSADCFQNLLFQKNIFQEYHPSVKQFNLISGFIWAQTVNKGYKQRTKDATGR